MQLTNFLHLVNDLDKSYTIFFCKEKNGPQWPIFKVNLTSSKCILACQKDKKPKTIQDILYLFSRLKQKNISLTVQSEGQEYHFFGIQIDPQRKRINLL
ncbi:hypothetical protein [uncultured Lactobacillus sp.]|uniref:hypothetical protein n=1 Tax=uncultured Lactobacillus sp. TaxID=153152 RepID=UPI002634353C|nr:hypothetical protein [uncultured Lactobacillus sp.]